MDYNNLLTHITELNNPSLNKLNCAYIEEAYRFTLTQSDLLAKLTELGDVTGWITWPDQVESFKEPQTIQSDSPLPPIEGELVTKGQTSVRFHYSGEVWHFIQQELPQTDSSKPANALIETIKLANKVRQQPDLEYIRIWQHDSELGLIQTNALFKGFAGGKQ